MAIDPDDTRPPYKQIAADLVRKIDSDEYPPNSKLPSQTELASAYGVARMTIRAALREPELMDRVWVRHGSGMYVRDLWEGGADTTLLRYLDRGFKSHAQPRIAYYGQYAYEFLDGVGVCRAGEEMTASIRVITPPGPGDDYPVEADVLEVQERTGVEVCIIDDDWVLMRFPEPAPSSPTSLIPVWRPLSKTTGSRVVEEAWLWFEDTWKLMKDGGPGGRALRS